VPFDYLEFDIKYIYVAGLNRNALLLTVIDVMSRWNLGRNDNGSQFIAERVQNFFKDENVKQEFCEPATPEQNAHIELYHSVLEKVICQ